MKAYLKFDLSDEGDKFDYECATKAYKYRRSLEEVGEEIFRPARKHGYNDHEIQALLSKIDDLTDGAGTTLVGLLESKFHRIKEENGALDD